MNARLRHAIERFKAALRRHPYDTEDPQIALEDEIRAIGYQFEKCRWLRISLPKFVRERYEAVLNKASGRMSKSAFNGYLFEGGKRYRR